MCSLLYFLTMSNIQKRFEDSLEQMVRDHLKGNRTKKLWELYPPQDWKVIMKTTTGSLLGDGSESFNDDGREFDVRDRDVRVWKRMTGFKSRHDRTKQRSLCTMFDSLPPTKKV